MQTAASVGSGTRSGFFRAAAGRWRSMQSAAGTSVAAVQQRHSNPVATYPQRIRHARSPPLGLRRSVRSAADARAQWSQHVVTGCRTIEVPSVRWAVRAHRTRWDSLQLKASNVSSGVAAALTQKQPALARRYLSRDCLDKVKSLLPETLGSTSACASFTTRSIRCPCGRKSILSTAKSSRTARQSHRTRRSISQKGTEPPSQAALRVTHSPQLPMTIASNRYYACRRKAAAADCDPIT